MSYIKESVQEEVQQRIQSRNERIAKRLQRLRADATKAATPAPVPALPRTLRNLLEAYRPGARHPIHVACEADAWHSDSISATLAAAMKHYSRGNCTVPLTAPSDGAVHVLPSVESNWSYLPEWLRQPLHVSPTEASDISSFKLCLWSCIKFHNASCDVFEFHAAALDAGVDDAAEALLLLRQLQVAVPEERTASFCPKFPAIGLPLRANIACDARWSKLSKKSPQRHQGDGHQSNANKSTSSPQLILSGLKRMACEQPSNVHVEVTPALASCIVQVLGAQAAAVEARRRNGSNLDTSAALTDVAAHLEGMRECSEAMIMLENLEHLETLEVGQAGVQHRQPQAAELLFVQGVKAQAEGITACNTAARPAIVAGPTAGNTACNTAARVATSQRIMAGNTAGSTTTRPATAEGITPSTTAGNTAMRPATAKEIPAGNLAIWASTADMAHVSRSSRQGVCHGRLSNPKRASLQFTNLAATSEHRDSAIKRSAPWQPTKAETHILASRSRSASPTTKGTHSFPAKLPCSELLPYRGEQGHLLRHQCGEANTCGWSQSSEKAAIVGAHNHGISCAGQTGSHVEEDCTSAGPTEGVEWALQAYRIDQKVLAALESEKLS
jgi:hypothetical protein